MTKEQIEQGNKMFAEFMGLEQGKIEDKRWSSDWFDPKGVINGRRNEKLLFHSSWDWLMPVVIECFNRYDAIESNNTNHQFILNDALIECNIDSLYKAVIEFIKWYNAN